LNNAKGPRKIVFISAMEGFSWGGSEHLWSGAAEKLARRGVQVSVSVKDWGEPVKQVEQLRAAGCRIFLRPTPSLARRAIRKVPPWREYIRSHVRRHLTKIGAGADLIVVSQGGNSESVEWLEAARANGYAYAIIAQAAVEAWWPDDALIERLAAAYEAACCSFFVSEANLTLTRQQFVAPLRHARVVRNPFNVRYDARPVWPTDSSDELRLACVGRLDAAAKGQDILFEMLNLPHWRERKAHVSLVGNGRTERALRRWAETLKLPNVTFEGFSENIEEIWGRHHALVLPSRWEGMPLVLVEAMLCGRPAIITDVAGARELVRDGVNGFLAKAPTVELLDEAMNRAWENRHRLREMGEQAAIDVRKFVSPDPVEDFVRELLALVDSPCPAEHPAQQHTMEART
jgi:glycosyltransferase involved in cell wall biosynthesis